MAKEITLTRPDDWHLHLRDTTYMSSIVNDSARFFERAVIMPNLSRPIVHVAEAMEYRSRIVNSLRPGSSFSPLMTLFLTAQTKPDEVRQSFENDKIAAMKLYPVGVTTHSDRGVQSLDQCDSVFSTMQDIGMPLLLHGEVTDSAVDIFDREKVFIETILDALIRRYPALKIVMEHVTTKDGVDYVKAGSSTLAATITAHHLLLNRNDMLVGGIKPHSYCLPVIKSERHRKALVEAATSGDSKFFLGTDSAPHPRSKKESAIGAAGVYTANNALPLYAEVFDSVGKLDKLEGFASFFGADFYNLKRNTRRVTLEKSRRIVEDELIFGDTKLVPFRAGGWVQWKLKQSTLDHQDDTIG